MRSAHAEVTSFLRQVILASKRAAAASVPLNSVGTLPGPCAVNHSNSSSSSTSRNITTWLDFWLQSSFPACRPLADPSRHTSTVSRGLSKTSNAPLGSHTPSFKAATFPSSSSRSGDNISGQAASSSSSSTAAPTSTAPRSQHSRGKLTRLHVRSPVNPTQPATRSAKDKAAKFPSPKAAAAMAAVKAGGGQQPLPREARLQLDAQLAEMPLPPAPFRGRHAAADGPRSVHVTGFYTGHPFTRASAEAVAAKLRNQPLARGIVVTGVYHDHEDALIIMTVGSASPPPSPSLSSLSSSSLSPPSTMASSSPNASCNPPTTSSAAAPSPSPSPSASETATEAAGAALPPLTASPSPVLPLDAVGGPPAGPRGPMQIPVPAAPAATEASVVSEPSFQARSPASEPAVCLGDDLGVTAPSTWAAEGAEGGSHETVAVDFIAEGSHASALATAAIWTGPGTGSQTLADGVVAVGGGGGALEGVAGLGVLSSPPPGAVGCGRSARLDTACMAVMLLEYGGIVFFNVPESMHVEALARVTAAALPDSKPADLGVGLGLPLPSQAPLRGPSRADAEAWRQAVAEKLSVHKEEQLIVVDPNMIAGRGTGRWIRKLDDSLHIWAWDSTNLESIARVLSQSAAIRYYNHECEGMLERYETIMPLGYEPSDQQLSGMDRLLFWRSRLPLRDLRQMVFKSSGIRVRLDSRLGLREPPSGTWESARHHAVWDAIRREFELDDRRDTLMEKTDLLKQSCLDLISANNESFTKRSELSIILLITMEIVISLTDMHSSLSAENVSRAVTWVMNNLGWALGVPK